MRENFTVLFAVDGLYATHLGVALYSLLKNNERLKFRIVVFTSRIEQKDRDNLTKIAKSFDTCIEFEVLEESLFDGLKLNYHFQNSNYYRLFAEDFIKDDMCLYLDADIVVTSSIADLLDIDLGNYCLAAVENPGFDRHNELGMQVTSKYFNSGVMLLNLHKWRDLGIKDKVINFVKKNPAVVHFVDQCGLNSVVDGDWMALNFMYNVQTSMLDSQVLSLDFVRNNSKIIHFTGSSKPWHLNNNHPFKKVYWKNRNRTPYKSFFADDFSFVNMVKFLCPACIKFALKKFLKCRFN